MFKMLEPKFPPCTLYVIISIQISSEYFLQPWKSYADGGVAVRTGRKTLGPGTAQVKTPEGCHVAASSIAHCIENAAEFN